MSELGRNYRHLIRREIRVRKETRRMREFRWSGESGRDRREYVENTTRSTRIRVENTLFVPFEILVLILDECNRQVYQLWWNTLYVLVYR